MPYCRRPDIADRKTVLLVSVAIFGFVGGYPYSLHYMRVTGREVETPVARSIHRKTRLVPCAAAISTTCERNRSK